MAKSSYQIRLIAGDGIGPEVVGSARRVLSAVGALSPTAGSDFDRQRAGYVVHVATWAALRETPTASAEGLLGGAMDPAHLPADAKLSIPVLRQRLGDSVTDTILTAMGEHRTSLPSSRVS